MVVSSLPLFATLSADRPEGGFGVWVVLPCLGILSILVGVFRYRATKRLFKASHAEV